MKSNVIVASTLAALTVGGLVEEALVSAESAETHCAAPTSCTERPMAVEPCLPDMPEHNAAHGPAVQLIETNGPATTSSLPPWIDDGIMPRRHHIPWWPRTQVDDEAWLLNAVRFGQIPTALRAIID
jgi:hypothetical protein